MVRNVLGAVAFISMLATLPALSQEPVDLNMVNRIRNEGFHHSQVMETVAFLTDVIGPRLSGSPALKRANEWTLAQLQEWGLENAHLEALDFGRGWSFSYAAVHMVKPHQFPLSALPEAWTPGTKDPIHGPVMKVELKSEEDFEKYRGKLEGKILLLDDEREVKERDKLFFNRYTEEQLSKEALFSIPTDHPESEFRKRYLQRWKFSRMLNVFLAKEKALATIEVSSRDNGLVRVGGGGSREVDGNPGVPSLVMATEHYNWILRLLNEDKAVDLEINVKARFHDEDTQIYNSLAEIPGTDKKDEIVMLGGHLDSWHSGTGATDNAAGCAVAMEAVRILKALGVRPRRTIRIALWSGEEQGLFGSRAYVKEHFASRPETEDPEQKKLPSFLREEEGPLSLKPEHAKLSAYFNLDNGSGRIRGIYTQENVAVVPIFDAWLLPFEDLGADTVTTQNTGGTDHLAFDRVGLPGFQFIQDDLDYSSRTHHTVLDVYDHLRQEDLMQASVIMASFVYHAAMRDEMLPRKPMPKDEPKKATTEN